MRRYWLGPGCVALLLWALPAFAQQKLQLDPARTEFGFEIRTRFGQKIAGLFPQFEGDVLVLPDGRHQVRLRMPAAAVEIPDKPRYTAWMRGEDFFDAVPGGVSLPSPLLQGIVEETAEALLRNGARRMLVVNGHGGSVHAVDAAGRALAAALWAGIHIVLFLIGRPFLGRAR